VSSIEFARAVRSLGPACHALGLATPAFRTPPRVRGAVRTIRWLPSGAAVGAGATTERPWASVLADLVDGVIAANQLDQAQAVRVRLVLWEALGGGASAAA
jgi:hypothetical protein